MMAMSAGTVSNYFLGMDIPLLKWIHLQTKRNELIRIFQLTYVYTLYILYAEEGGDRYVCNDSEMGQQQWLTFSKGAAGRHWAQGK